MEFLAKHDKILQQKMASLRSLWMFGGKVLYALQPFAAKAELQYLRY